ncbi:hypothetical protein NPIL_90011 [Nephila pilipes]|uniref:Uncharacterized protein n=1 Tax=Nephila pilipes TaxID=299642 RepID=A0A8X6N1H1_NEPPI|nr:hypothetical protein NPIL_90011 [Nephila pilipes]
MNNGIVRGGRRVVECVGDHAGAPSFPIVQSFFWAVKAGFGIYNWMESRILISRFESFSGGGFFLLLLMFRLGEDFCSWYQESIGLSFFKLKLTM